MAELLLVWRLRLIGVIDERVARQLGTSHGFDGQHTESDIQLATKGYHEGGHVDTYTSRQSYPDFRLLVPNS